MQIILEAIFGYKEWQNMFTSANNSGCFHTEVKKNMPFLLVWRSIAAFPELFNFLVVSWSYRMLINT